MGAVCVRRWQSTVVIMPAAKRVNRESSGETVSMSARGIDLIHKYASGQELTESQMESMRATMYLITQYVGPPRDWVDFHWKGPEHFVREIWPQVKDRDDILHGFFSHGEKPP